MNVHFLQLAQYVLSRKKHFAKKKNFQLFIPGVCFSIKLNEIALRISVSILYACEYWNDTLEEKLFKTSSPIWWPMMKYQMVDLSQFWVCKRNPIRLPFKWKVLVSSSIWYYFLFAFYIMKFANFVEFWHFGYSLEVKLLNTQNPTNWTRRWNRWFSLNSRSLLFHETQRKSRQILQTHFVKYAFKKKAFCCRPLRLGVY